MSAPVLVDYDQTRIALEALHHYGFTVTIHSPKTSPDGKYMVTAYGIRDENLRASAPHLTDAIQQVAARLGTDRLSRFVYDRNLVARIVQTGGVL
jgi:hypothetical protein